MENFSTFVRTLGTQFVRGKKFFTTQIGVLGLLTDNTGSAGTAGKVLSSTGSGVQWITIGGGSSNVADLDDLTDVIITTASSGQLLRFNGTSWVNWTPNFLTAYGSLNDLSDVTLTTPLNGARLIYSSATSQWIDANPLGINKIYYGTSSGDSATTNVITNGTRLSVGTFAMPTNLNVGQVDITTGIIGEGSIHIGGVADEEVYLLASRNKIQVGSQIVTFVPGEGGGEQGTTTTTFTASTLNIQPIGGQTVFGGLVTATGFKTPSGTSLGFLKADGSVDTTQYLPSGEIDLDDLSDVIITSPSTGQILRYELPIGEFIPAWRNVTPGYLTPNSSIDSLVDVAISGAAADQLLRWNGTYWINWTPNFLTSFTETDPTVPAHVKDISTTDISSWDAGYNDSIRGISFNTSTGVLTLTQMDLGTLTVDLDGRYLESYTETDPVFSASPAAGIEGQSIEKWDQAFSWGDHSLVGYLTEESDTLDTVTSRGNTTANTIDVGGITTPYVQFEEVEEAHGIARSINWSEDHNSLEVFYADEKHFDVGQDQMWHVKNGDEDTLLKGTVVMAIGAVGNSGKLEVAPLVADGTVSGRYAIGILMDDIRNGEFGFVMTQGKLRGIDTGEFTEGDTLYPDPLIPGALVNVEPASPALKIPIAFVVTSHNNGAIAVRMTQGLDLHEVHDVQITSPVNGQILRLETGVWTNWTPSYIEAETDPVFIASPAANITVGAIEKWDTAYSWGDHSLIGYLTSFTETDPTVPAHVKSITEQNIIDWNGAYGWGDHASAGYLTSYENNYISNVKLSESTLEFTGIGSAFNSTVDLSTLPFAPQGSYLTAEADTLQSVTTRGSSTTTGATFGGNVGIGTTEPNAKLYVKGNAIDNVGLTVLENDYSSGDIYYPTLSVINTRGNHSYGIVAEFRINTAADTDRPTILFYGEQASHSWQIGQVTSGWGSADSFGIGYRASNDPTSFNSWPTSYFTILTGGNVGIGNTNPTAKLQVGAEAHPNATGIEVAAGAGGANLLARDSSSHHNWLPYTDGNNYYSAAGHNFRSSEHGIPWVSITASDFTWSGDTVATQDWVTSQGYLTSETDSQTLSWDPGSKNLSISNGNTVTLDGLATEDFVTSQGYITGSYLPLTGGTLSGAVVVNLGNVNSDTVAFKVGGPSNYDSLTIGMEDSPDYDAFIASFGNDIRFYSGKGVATENHSFYWFTSKAGTSQHSVVAMQLDHNQNLTIGGTFTEQSSIRYKENVKSIPSVSQKVGQLDAVSYNKIGGNQEEIGLIAEDVAELFPEVVKYDKEGRPDGVNYSRLSVILLKAVQELSQEVNELKKKLN